MRSLPLPYKLVCGFRLETLKVSVNSGDEFSTDVPMTGGFGYLIKKRCHERQKGYLKYWTMEKKTSAPAFTLLVLVLISAPLDGITVLDPCSTFPCENGGNCVKSPYKPSDFTCYCRPLNTGMFCDKYIDLPPTCSAQNVTVVFSDTNMEASMSLEKVNCSTERMFLLNFTETVEHSGPFVIVASDGNPATDFVLQFQVSVTEDLLYWVGQYELTQYVDNELGLTTVNWYITVKDVNQEPRFLNSSYFYIVDEYTALGSLVAAVHVQKNGTGPTGWRTPNPEPIIVWDPDNFTVMYEFKELTVKGVDIVYPNSTNVTVLSQSGLPIQLVRPWRFEVVSLLSPGIEYRYKLQATDGANGTDNTLVSFYVRDVNDPPTCRITPPAPSLDLVTSVGTVVYILNCSDPDVNETLSRLKYAERTILDSGYFSVNQSGYVTLEARVPVDVNTLTYSVNVTDAGGLSVDVNITFLVNRNYPPQCGHQNISVSLPEDATTAHCVNASLNCGHDSALHTHNLTMNVSLTHNTDVSVSSMSSKAAAVASAGTGTGGRSVTYSVEFVFTVCPINSLLGKFGQYDWDITVASALGSTQYNGNITVVDTNQAPQFQELLYHVDVSEMTRAGDTVAQVVTKISPGSSPVPEILVTDIDTLIQYRFNNVTVKEVVIVYPNSTNVTVSDQFGLPILFGRNSIFYVAYTNPPAGMIFQFTLQASDFGGLTNTTLVIITVRDVNQPPTCPRVTPQTLDVVRSPGQAVYTLSCTDLDVNETLSSLTFGAGTILDFDYFSINQSGVIILTQNVPLNRTTLMYSVHVVDGGGLSADVNITFNINSNYPPQCNPLNLSVSIPEDALTTECVPATLRCGHHSALDTHNLTINVTSSASSTYFTVSNAATAVSVPSGLVTYNVQFVFTICPNVSLLGRYGQYDWDITVASALGSTHYNGNITVVDTNQAPRFQQLLYQVDVSEKTPMRTTVAKVVTSGGSGSSALPEILVMDSDTLSQYRNSNVTVTEVVTVYPNSTNVTAQSQVGVPIQLGETGSSWNFVVYYTLLPEVIYRFKLQAQDQGGLTNTTIVVFTILDINENPSCQTVKSLPLDLLTSPRTSLYNLSCSDADVNETLSKLNYEENTVLDYDYFQVDSNGTVFLTNPVPLNRTTLTYSVLVKDGGGLSTDVNISFTTNRNYPPRCTPAAAHSTFLETAGRVTCAPVLVTCADTASRSLIPSVSIISDDTKGLIITSTRITNTTGWVQLNACVASTTRQLNIGQFVMKLNVSTDLGSTTLQWNITVEDVNAPPSFDLPIYNTTVSEKVAIGTTVAVVRNTNDPVGNNTPLDIVMKDPDTVTDNFTIKYLTFVVRAEYTDGRPFENSFNMTTTPVNLSARALVVQTKLRPDLVYIVVLTAEDGGGLKANTTLYIRVNDVNDPPNCDPVSPGNLTLVTQVSTMMLKLSCSDPDFNSSFRSISYFAYTEANYTFFNVSESGDVILARAVPRDALVLTLKAYAVDGGGLRNNMTVNFPIFRNYTPTCTPTIRPPSVWRKDECFRLIPNCRDPAAPQGNNSFIRYSFEGDFLSAFRENVSLTGSDFAEYCYNWITNGTFNVQLTADSGLGVFTWAQQLNVRYLSETPRFEFNQYQDKIRETTSVNTTVLTVRATVGTGVTMVQVLYSLEGGNSFTWYFGIDPNRGQVNVTANLRNVSGSSLSTRVWARDPDTGQNSSVLITINIEDVNQPPSCASASVNVTVPWTVAVGQTVAKVTCSDADPTPAFNTLTYDLMQAGNVGAAWMIHPRTGEVSLAPRSGLSPELGKYELTVQANDSTFADVANVTIYVNRTAPKPTVQVTYIGSNSATFSWTSNNDYISVIDGYTVRVLDSQGFVIDTGNTTQNVTTYATRTSLTATTPYTVVVTVRGKGGDVTSDRAPFVTEEVAILTKASTEIMLLNETWTADLLNNQSAAFKGLQSRLTNAMDSGLRARSSLPGLENIFVRSFRKGTVIADVVITINQKTRPSDLENNLSLLIQPGSIGDLAVDPKYKPFYLSETYITDVKLELTATSSVNISSLLYVIVDADIIVTCHARAPGISAPNFRWLMNDSEIAITARYKTSPLPLRSDDDPYGFHSHLNISRVVLADGGTLTCNVSDGATSVTRDIALTAKTGLSVTLTPLTSVVTSGSKVTLNCTRVAGYHVNWTAVVYRVENNVSMPVRYQEVTQGVTQGESVATFIVSADGSFKFQCEVSDAGGNSTSNFADVFVLKSDDMQCPNDGNWIATPAGKNFSLKCPAEYEGAFYRICGADGRWGPVNSSGCVRKELRSIIQGIEQSTTNSSQAVERLYRATQGSLLQGDVMVAVDILDRVANDSVTKPPDNDTLMNFIKSADNVLQAPTEVWQNRTPDAFSLVRAVDTIGEAAGKGLGNGPTSVQQDPIHTDKIVLQLGRSSQEDIIFPIRSKANDYPQWLMETDNSAFLSKDALPAGATSVQYSAVMFRNLSNVFSGALHASLTMGGLSEQFVNTPILTLTVSGLQKSIQPPVRLTFEHVSENFSDATCQFLDFSTNPEASWSSKGCTMVSSNKTTTVCSCDHLTSFAVLMSPYRPTGINPVILTIITIVGCSISIFCLFATIVVYGVLWRYVKSDRSVVLVNLCVVLLLAYVVFLAGVDRTENEIACKVVSALLHYLFLVVFFLMLCEGLDIFISIVIVFPIKSVLIKLLLMAYGVPAIVVAVSLGVRLEGYGGPDTCWLSLKDGLLWAFIGPALAALLANFVFVALVIRALLSSTHLLTKSQRERAKSIVKAICVMTPILGLTWIFGVFYVNEETVAFQYLFLIFNTLQGLLIFIFHCLLSKQVRDGFKSKKRRYQAKSSDVGSKSHVSQKPNSESTMSTSNDLDKPISPFLQADRQVQQMAAKVSRLEDINLFSTDNPPKDVFVKDAGVAMAMSNPAFNIGTADETLNIRRRDYDLLSMDSKLYTGYEEIPVEAGNVQSVAKPTEYEVAEGKFPVKKVSSLEDNAQQTGYSRRPSKRSDGSGSKTSSSIGARPKEFNSKERASSGSRSPLTKGDQQQRLDHVYGAGARISDSSDSSDKLRNRNAPRGARTSQSSDDVSSFPVHKNPVYNDVVPALSPTDRWLSGAPTSSPVRHQFPLDPRSPQQASQYPTPPFQQQVRPPSPRRMSASAEHLGKNVTALYHPFSGVRGEPDNKRPPPRVAPKPGKGRGGWRDPPVDYW